MATPDNCAFWKKKKQQVPSQSKLTEDFVSDYCVRYGHLHSQCRHHKDELAAQNGTENQFNH